MNDLMYVYLDFDPADKAVMQEVDRILIKLDDLLKEHNWEYMGHQNMYRPVKGTDPDDTYHEAQQAVLNAEWLKQYKPYFAMGALTNACDMEKIIIENEKPVPEEKLKRYSEYFDHKKEYAHGIIVDENNVLRDGYATYVLARGSVRRPDIMMVRSGQIFKKAVRGRVADRTENGFKDTDERGTWYCDIEPAVIPGDILRAETDEGIREIRVERVFYLAGKYACGKYKDVVEHTGLVDRGASED